MKNKAAQALQKLSWEKRKKSITDVSAHFKKLRAIQEERKLTNKKNSSVE